MYLSFETAKHLHELGVTFPESPIGYLIIQGKNQGLYVPPENGVLPDNSCLIKTACFEEVWAKLPPTVVIDSTVWNKVMGQNDKGETWIAYERYPESRSFYERALEQANPSPTEAAGKLVGILKEKNLI